MGTAAPNSDDRPLTAREVALVRWLLEHGKPEALDFLPQLAAARVVSRCPCGCASIDFAVGGVKPPADAGMESLSHHLWRAANGSEYGVFVFAMQGQLAGVEVWWIDGDSIPSALPAVEELLPL